MRKRTTPEGWNVYSSKLGKARTPEGCYVDVESIANRIGIL